MSLACNMMTVNAQPYGVCSVDPASVRPVLAAGCRRGERRSEDRPVVLGSLLVWCDAVGISRTSAALRLNAAFRDLKKQTAGEYFAYTQSACETTLRNPI